jgi:hypothetical protein
MDCKPVRAVMEGGTAVQRLIGELSRTYDEENYQIGFVDVADTPYAETIAASREVGCNLYRAEK